MEKKQFDINPIIFRINADFEADNEKDDFCIGNKTTTFYKGNPILNGYNVVSELEDILKSDYYKSHLGYDEVDWFVNEVIKLGNKVTFYFENTEKDIVMTDEDEEDCRKKFICSFCEKNTESKKVGDHCQLTGKYRGPAQKNGKIIDTQDKSKDIPFISHNLTNYVCHMFSQNLVDKKNDKVKFDN